jgi:hypothetical protein
MCEHDCVTRGVCHFEHPLLAAGDKRYGNNNARARRDAAAEAPNGGGAFAAARRQRHLLALRTEIGWGCFRTRRACEECACRH